MDNLSIERFDEVVQAVFAVFSAEPDGGNIKACGATLAAELRVRLCLEELLCQCELGFKERQASERARQKEQAHQARQHRLGLLQRELARERFEKENALHSLAQCKAQLAELKEAHSQAERALAASASKRGLAEHACW